MIGIIGAMPIEIADLKERMDIASERVIAGITFYQGDIHGAPCVLACCSPGKVNAAACTQAMIMAWAPSLVINSGVAGGIGRDVRMGDLVIAESVVQHDMDTSALGDQKGYISGINQIYLPADKAASGVIREAARRYYDGAIHTGIIASGDQFISSNRKLEELSGEFGAVACEMEGGSIGHVCVLNRTPFCVLRTISDNGNDDAAVDFTQFAKTAAEKSTALLYDILPELCERTAP